LVGNLQPVATNQADEEVSSTAADCKASCEGFAPSPKPSKQVDGSDYELAVLLDSAGAKFCLRQPFDLWTQRAQELLCAGAEAVMEAEVK
jgi:hypothetical protein